MRFSNNSSQCLFIGTRDLGEVIAQDSKELKEIGGSFEAIADRMEQIDSWAVEKGYILPNKEFMTYMDPLFKKYENKSLDDRNSKDWKRYCREWAVRMAKHSKTWYDSRVAVVRVGFTRGFQECPFDGCRTTWGEDVEIVSRKTGRELTVNKGTAHLARVHHLLEKDNAYGIGAREFYEAFMPD